MKASLKSYWPTTLPQWRWGIQTTVTTALTLPLMYISDWNLAHFNGDALWITMGGAMVIDATRGGTFAKMVDRVGSAIIVGCYVLLMLKIGEALFTSQKDIEWFIYATNPLAAFLASWLNSVFPLRSTLHLYCMSILPTLESAITKQYDIEKTVAFKIADVLLGIAISTVVISFVVPSRASDQLANSLSTILNCLGACLEKSIDLHSEAISAMHPRARKPEQSLTEKPALEQQPSDLQKSSAVLWKQMDNAFTTLTKFGLLIKGAKHEFRVLHAPHFYPVSKYSAVFNSSTALYSQVVSLLATLDVYRYSSGSPVQKGQLGSMHRMTWNADALRAVHSVGGLELMEKGIHPALIWSAEFVPELHLAAECAADLLKKLSEIVKGDNGKQSIESFRFFSSARLGKLVAGIQHHKDHREEQVSRLITKCVMDEIASAAEFSSLMHECTGISAEIYEVLSAEAREAFWNSHHYSLERISITCQSLHSLYRGILESEKSIRFLVLEISETQDVYTKFKSKLSFSPKSCKGSSSG